MSTTTQILFNSPALHSLKRDQLVKLCKIHSIKASGKNVDLVERLKQHATQLPRDSPLSVAARSEDQGVNDVEDDEEGEGQDKENVNPTWRGMSRPSEQWEVVMESIQEVEESSSQGTLTSLKTIGSNGFIPNEFGTAGSKTVSSVSSSIKALATSLGLKRNNTAKSTVSTSTTASTSQFPLPPPLQIPFAPNGAAPSDLAQHSIPYAALTPTTPRSMPQTECFTFSPPDFHPPVAYDSESSMTMPIPGNTHRPGVPAPANARLSLGTGGGTTIRLVSMSSAMDLEENGTPKLKAFKTTFDLVARSPVADGSAWPPRSLTPEVGQRIYTTLPSFGDTKPQGVQMMDTNTLHPPAFTFGGNISPTRSAPKTSATPTPEPFIFGSPLPQHKVSNAQFRNAAAEVMEEMNKRLAEAGVKPVESDLLVNRGKGLFTIDTTGGSAKDEGKKGGATYRFDKIHEEQFKKMDSIAGHWAVTKGTPEKAGVGMKRKSSVFGNGNGLRAKPKPRGSVLGRAPAPALGSRRVSTSAGMRRASGARVISSGVRKKMGVIPGGFGDEEDDEEEDVEARRKRVRTDNVEGESASGEGKEREKRVSIAPPQVDLEEQERKLKEREAIRRKLDQNKARRRSSMGRPSLVAPQKAKGMASRFGFLSSAKSMVQSVWKGVGSSKTTASGIPTSKSAPKAIVEPKKLSKMGPPSVKKPAVSNANRSTVVRARSVSRSLKAPAVTGTINSSRSFLTSGTRARSPIPAFGSTTTRTSSSTVSSRTGSSIGTASSRAANSRVGSRDGSITGASSIGTRSSLRMSSLGTRGSLASIAGGSVGSTGAKRMSTEVKSSVPDAKTTRARTSSRLMAPTASSLARAGGSIRSSTSISSQEPVMALASVGEEERSSTGQVALTTIKNSAVNRVHGSQSPRPEDNVSNPFVPASSLRSEDNDGDDEEEEGEDEGAENIVEPLKPRVPAAGRKKPRISRSKVIAKLASQRAASGAFPSSSSRARSSLGALKAGRARRTSGGGGVVMSAKKRARQSEYARRRSRAAVGGVGKMDVGE